MSKQTVEEIKIESHGLRGTIDEVIRSGATHFEEGDFQLMKFHGSYQQDDRDRRAEARKLGLDKAYSFMVRSKMAGGAVTAAQYLAHDEIARDLASGTIRLTTRQGVQFHGVLIGGLRDLIKKIVNCGLTTSGACGDIVRNTMGPASPIRDAAHEDAQTLAEELSERFLSRSGAYMEIWVDGEKVETTEPQTQDEPLYGKLYLPRKFKIAIAIPPRNDTDVLSNDVGLIPHIVNGNVLGYNIVVGGGFGMAHGQKQTFPRLASPLCYVPRPHVADAVEAVVKVQRDHGNREDRKQARLKYLIESRGIPWFLEQTKTHCDFPLEEPKPFHFKSVEDMMGWHEQHDGRWFIGIRVEQGRIIDVTNGPAYRTFFREVCTKFGLPMRITPNTNIILHDIPSDLKNEIDALLLTHALPTAESLTASRRIAHACVALPTCGLSLAESERVFASLMDSVDTILRDLGMAEDLVLIRMTGCPNGCSRPYNADISFVGRGPQKYAMFVGGSSRGDRLAGLYKKSVTFDDAPAAIKELLEAYVAERQSDEIFSDWWLRCRTTGEAPHPDQFHVELTERAANQQAAEI